MRTLFLLAAPVFAACMVEAPSDPTESSVDQHVETHNKITANKITANKITANKITANKITANKITANKLSVNLDTAGDLLSTEDGQEVFSFLISCALPADITLVADLDDGTHLEFPGDIGLAPSWVHRSLNDTDKGWVSACMFSRVNNQDVFVPISLRGPSNALRADHDERAQFTLEEGAFYGNMFTRDNEPIVWIACRGRDQAAGDAGSLANRNCAEPDPTHPGLTKCGFTFAGDCADFVRPRNNYACEDRNDHGTYYTSCEDHAGFPDNGHHGRNNHNDCHDHEHVFDQVITTFVGD